MKKLKYHMAAFALMVMTLISIAAMPAKAIASNYDLSHAEPTIVLTHFEAVEALSFSTLEMSDEQIMHSVVIDTGTADSLLLQPVDVKPTYNLAALDCWMDISWAQCWPEQEK